ncbi:MAG: ferredoxin [Solirubrobacteraceae bacterium]
MSEKLHLDPIACSGHGLCAELFPERIWLDEWGYPVIEQGELSRELLVHARRAVDACPTLALRLGRERRATAARSGAGLRPAGREPR